MRGEGRDDAGARRGGVQGGGGGGGTGGWGGGARGCRCDSNVFDGCVCVLFSWKSPSCSGKRSTSGRRRKTKSARWRMRWLPALQVSSLQVQRGQCPCQNILFSIIRLIFLCPSLSRWNANRPLPLSSSPGLELRADISRSKEQSSRLAEERHALESLYAAPRCPGPCCD